MNTINKLRNYFTKGELALWLSSVMVILVSFFIFDREGYLTLIASIIGVTALILNAKGNPLGQLIMLGFCMIYGYISYTFAYYGEMITYMGMSAPMAAYSLYAWLKNPFKNKKTEVKINSLSKKEYVLMVAVSILVTQMFYYILRYFGTANLTASTLSVITSFGAAYLTARRSPLFALVYAANDVVLIVMWLMATIEDPSYYSVIICFVVFLINDMYSYIKWLRMQKRQASET